MPAIKRSRGLLLRFEEKFDVRFSVIVSLAFGALATPAWAQDQDQQIWVALDASFEVAEGVNAEVETNQRFGNDDGGLYESQYLVALNVEIADGVTLTGGLNRVVGRSAGAVTDKEWRPRQEIDFPIARIGPGAFAGRVRLEQRFRSDSDDVGHRIRPKLTYELPLLGELDLELAHESYFNLNGTDFGQIGGHERMRNSVTFSIPIAE